MTRLMAKKAVWGALLVSVVANTALAADWGEALFAEKGHDFGAVPRGAKLRHSFVLTNRLKEPVTILNVHASCGCTTGKANASVVPPGQTAVVEAEMDTRNFVDRKETVLFVSMVNAAGTESEVRLNVSSTILSDVVLNPGQVDFGSVTKGQSPTQVLTIERIGSPKWKVERMVSSSRVLNASMTETCRSEEQVVYTLSVSLKPDAPTGSIRDEIRIITNDLETAIIPVLVTAQVRGDLVASPNSLSLGKATSAGSVQGRFIVRSSKPFAIQAIEGTGDGFKMYEADASRRAMHIVTVVYKQDEGTSRGDLRKTFKILTDLPGESPLELNASLRVEP